MPGNSTHTIRMTPGGVVFENIEDIVGYYNERVDVSLIERATEVIKEEKGVDYKIDLEGRKIPMPLAVVREEFGESKLNDGEETEADYVKLHIIEQQKSFMFRVEFNRDGEITNGYDTNCVVKLGSSSHFDEMYMKNHCEMWFNGSSDMGRERYFTVPIEVYSKVKRAMQEVGVTIIEDEKKEAIMEELKEIDYTFNETPTAKDIEEMISQVDLNTFTKLIKARLSNEGNTTQISDINNEWAKKYLETWAINKFKFYRMFGNKLSLQFEIEVEKDETEMGILRNSLIGKFPLYRRIFDGITKKAFRENSIKTKTAGNISESFFEDVNVKNNMSLTKFFSLFGNKELDIEISKIYQDKGKAHLNISINPIDFLTVSVNKSGWESCHHFYKGCYRNAGLSYMNDGTSMVSFRSETDMDINIAGKKINWNTKNWRQMIYMSETNSTTVFSRQYPYDSEQLSRAVRREFEECISNYFGGSHKWKLHNHQENANTDVDIGGEYDLLYNDVSHGYGHKVVRAKDDKNKEYTKIYIGETVDGVISGRTVTNGENSIW